ncbi:MAG: molybdopterin oxidoreductase family protein [Gemmataceae bacterium]|nr:molybdopterin oxidoreductase family protein [Gemmataceae bacterium]MDW8243541.1 molybdopterin oxidoreductase family protein [Thermogemmata sp.]
MPVSLPQLDVAAAGRTSCPFCAFQCGLIITEGADGWSVSGDPHFPVNQGRLCIKGWSAAEMLRHPQRLYQPLLHGQAVDWNTAFDYVAERLRQVQQRSGPAAVAVFGSGALTNEKVYWLGKFARLVLRTPHIDYNGRYCMSSAAAASLRAFGIDRGLPFPISDIPLARTILLVGGNPFETLPPMAYWFEQQRRNGGRLIVADPRRSATARTADLHLPVTPGSDLALANGLLFIAIEEGWIDQTFVRTRTNGFDSVYRTALQYHPAWVEQITGVPEAAMRQTVRWLAEKPSLILTGRGAEQHSKGVDTVLAFINLALALGQVGQPGGGYASLTGQANGQGGREHGQKADQLPGYRLIEVAAHREQVARLWGIDPSVLPSKGLSACELLQNVGQPDGIQALLVLGSNLLVASPHIAPLRQRLQKLELLVVCDTFLNETAQLAHVVLPTTQWAEEDGTVTNLEGRLVRRRRIITPPPGVRSDLDILQGLAQRLGAGQYFPSSRPEDVFAELCQVTAEGLANYAGFSYERLERNDSLFWPCPDPEHPGTPYLFADRFYHPDGKARFCAVEYRPAAEEPDCEYPLYLTTGRQLEQYNSGAQTRRLNRLCRARPVATVQIHPEVAARYNIRPGDAVLIATRRAQATFIAELTPEIRTDTLFVPFHWGGAQSANLLTNAALDPVSRMPEFKVAAARIVEVYPGSVHPSDSVETL